MRSHSINTYSIYLDIFLYIVGHYRLVIYLLGPQSRTLQPVHGKGYEPAYKSRASAETHPRLGAGGCRSVSGG